MPSPRAEAMDANVAVVGAGVVGLSTALRLAQELPGARVTVLADRFESETTSAGAAGLWEPFKLSETPPELVRRWGGDTFQFLQRLWMSTEAAEAGVSQTTVHQLWSEPREAPDWLALVPHFHRMDAAELAPFNVAAGGTLRDGWSFSTLVCEGSLHLRWLRARLEAAGVRIVKQRLTSLQELAGYDLVCNCTGLGAAQLFGDASVFPIRGHVLRVRAPFVKAIYFTDELTYVIPNRDTVVLGGTGGVGEWSTQPTEADRAAIWQRCVRMLPSLAKAEFVSQWVGLRPGRKAVRLESELLQLPGRPAPLPVVHNYGHGGAGLTLAWGCAGDAAALAADALRRRPLPAKL